MNKVLLLVEGQTEETFVTRVLRPYFQQYNVWLQPVLIHTRRDVSGQTYRGGAISYHQIKRQLKNLLGDTSAICVTTMLDYYRLPRDFPGQNTLPDAPPSKKVSHLEQAFQADINDQRFLPYLMLHEFEALVLADPSKICDVFPEVTSYAKLIQAIGGRRPEDINDQNPPSKLIQTYFPDYQKRLHGPRIVQHIGLPQLRQQCAHFDQWISQLEQRLS